MPKRRRATGAGRPFRYEKTWTTMKDGVETIHHAQRWMQQIDVGTTDTGRRKMKTFTASTSAKVTEKIRAWRQRLRENDGVDIDSGVTLGMYSRIFLEGKKTRVDPKSYRMYSSVITNHLHDYLDKPLSEFTPSTITAIIAQAKAHDRKGRVTGPAGTSLRKQIRTTLHGLMEQARRDRIIPHNPAEKIPLPQSHDTQLDQIRHERTAFTIPEMERMLTTAAAYDDKALATRMWFRLLTGMRQTEILGATRRDLHLRTTTSSVMRDHEVERTFTITDADGVRHTGTTTVTEKVPEDIDVLTGEYVVNWKLEELQKDHGCGPRIHNRWPCGRKRGADCPDATWRVPEGFDMIHLTGRWCLTHPKSHTGRIVPIIPILAQILRNHLETIGGSDNPYDLLFTGPDGSPIDPKRDDVEFRTLLRDAHIANPESHYGHETRHSVVSLLASMGVDAQLIREIVGHSSEAMLEHYRHADGAERLTAMETLDTKLGLETIKWKTRGRQIS